ncbi:MAG: ABC transporter substrate-binding protein [Candidatus Rokubacteria bacterium]|nr:ABC transporter substrate-binding protein [Candidatus Rokubacteria bacterium]
MPMAVIAWLLSAALLAAEPAPLTVAVAGPPTEPSYLPLYVAEALGTFEAEGVRVTLRRVKGEGSAVAALREGDAEVAATSVDQAVRLGWGRGTPLALVALTALSPPAALLVSARHRETIATVADLRGKRIAIPGPGTSVHHLAIHLLRRPRASSPRASWRRRSPSSRGPAGSSARAMRASCWTSATPRSPARRSAAPSTRPVSSSGRPTSRRWATGSSR